MVLWQRRDHYDARLPSGCMELAAGACAKPPAIANKADALPSPTRRRVVRWNYVTHPIKYHRCNKLMQILIPALYAPITFGFSHGDVREHVARTAT